MRFVYSPLHLRHDIRTQTVMGVQVDANEVAERAEVIRAALVADGGFELVSPTEHGAEPIAAVHDPGLLRFLETAWDDAVSAGNPYPFLAPETIPNRAATEGMSERYGHETSRPDGRAGYWALDTSTYIVEGTYAAARAAVDVALTTADLVLGGERAAYGLCRPPGHHAARSMYGGFCYFNNAAITAEAIARSTGAHVSILDLDYHHGNGTEQIFWRRGDVLYVSLHAHPDRQYPYVLGWEDETGEGRRRGRQPQHPAARGHDRRAVPRGARARPGADRGRAGRHRRRVARVRHVRQGPDLRLRADDAPSTTSADAGSPRSASAWSSSRRAATTSATWARTPVPGCAGPRGGTDAGQTTTSTTFSARSRAARNAVLGDEQAAGSIGVRGATRVQRPPVDPDLAGAEPVARDLVAEADAAALALEVQADAVGAPGQDGVDDHVVVRGAHAQDVLDELGEEDPRAAGVDPPAATDADLAAAKAPEPPARLGAVGERRVGAAEVRVRLAREGERHRLLDADRTHGEQPVERLVGHARAGSSPGRSAGARGRTGARSRVRTRRQTRPVGTASRCRRDRPSDGPSGARRRGTTGAAARSPCGRAPGRA